MIKVDGWGTPILGNFHIGGILGSHFQTPSIAGSRQALWRNGALHGARSAPGGAGRLPASGHGFGHSHPQVGNSLGMDGRLVDHS